jgi:hypothetical protein
MKEWFGIHVASLVLLVRLVAGCNGKEEEHKPPPPDGFVASCERLPAPDAEGCQGLPEDDPSASSLVYPKGCSATLTVDGVPHGIWCEITPRAKDAGPDAGSAFRWVEEL